jgi:hypothetical protein
MYHITLGDGLKFFVARHNHKMCGHCGEKTLFPYKTSPREHNYFCEIYCSQCGKVAETFTHGKYTLKPGKRKRGAR